MTFGKCQHEVCWNISTEYHERLEKEKRFSVHLEKVDNYRNILIEDPGKVITIIDQSGM